ncbi:PHP-associated domain-containing protein [Patescibacteria group bacterium]
MKLKTNLHSHSFGDPQDPAIKYTSKELIDYASSLGFGVLAITHHKSFAYTEELRKYAESKNILLISGIELNITKQKKHLLVLNCEKSIESVKTFEDLREYKAKHPEIFVIAPHPYFPRRSCLGNLVEENINLFDAIEHSWFYSKRKNYNKKAEEIAKKYNLPFISTSDTHWLTKLNKDYAEIEIEEKTVETVFEAIREGKFQNTTRPKRFITEMLVPLVIYMIKDYVARIKRIF